MHVVHVCKCMCGHICVLCLVRQYTSLPPFSDRSMLTHLDLVGRSCLSWNIGRTLKTYWKGLVSRIDGTRKSLQLFDPQGDVVPFFCADQMFLAGDVNNDQLKVLLSHDESTRRNEATSSKLCGKWRCVGCVNCEDCSDSSPHPHLSLLLILYLLSFPSVGF